VRQYTKEMPEWKSA